MSAYNGWTNYETWAVKLWIDNEEPSYLHWQSVTREVWDDCADKHSNAFATRSENARICLADLLKERHEDDAPTVAGVYADLLSAALGEVDWFEIADALLSDAELEGYVANT